MNIIPVHSYIEDKQKYIGLSYKIENKLSNIWYYIKNRIKYVNENNVEK